MKYILLALLLYSVPVLGKKNDVSVNGGVLTNIPLQKQYRDKYTPGFAPELQLKYMRYTKHHLFYGAGLSVGNIQYRYKSSWTDYMTNAVSSYDSKVLFANPGLCLTLYGGNSFQMKHSTINAGIAVSGMYNHIPKDTRSGYPNKLYYPYTNYGYRLGFFYEYIYYFNRLGIGFEIDVQYSHTIDDYRDFVNNTLMIPATLGVHYKI